MKSEFSRNVTTQILGTGIAQILPFLATPLLTRLFNEEDFALYTSFFAIATIFAVAVGGKYHLAIVLPKAQDEAYNLFILSLYLTVAYSLTITFFLPFFHGFFPVTVQGVLYYVPAYVLFFGLWSSYINLSIRHKKFSTNAISKVLQSCGYIIGAIALGLSKITLYGLVVAKIVGSIISCFFLFKKSIEGFKLIPIKNLKDVAIRYADYPKYGIWPSLLNTISLQALILILTKFYTMEDLGYYGLTHLVLSAPLALIGTSYQDVFYQKMAVLMSRGQRSDALSFLKRSAWALLFMGLPIGIILLFFGEPLFGFIFGYKWGRSGEFASILAISFVIKLVVSPLSAIFNATNTLRIAARWQVLYFISTFVVLGLSAWLFKLDVTELFIVYVIHEIVLYGVYFALQIRMIKFKEYTKSNNDK